MGKLGSELRLRGLEGGHLLLGVGWRWGVWGVVYGEMCVDVGGGVGGVPKGWGAIGWGACVGMKQLLYL